MVKWLHQSVIIHTDHAAILDIMQQSSIIFTSSTIRMNIWLVKALQFLVQFHLMVQHKPRKEQIIPDALSRLASANRSGHNSEYTKLDVLFINHIVLVQINTDLVKPILDGYNADK